MYFPIFLFQNEAPMMVAATAGTTVLGAYDDLNAIADVCQRHGIWLHCDVGQYKLLNGSVVFSNNALI